MFWKVSGNFVFTFVTEKTTFKNLKCMVFDNGFLENGLRRKILKFLILRNCLYLNYFDKKCPIISNNSDRKKLNSKKTKHFLSPELH